MKKMLLIDGYSILFRAYYATAFGTIMRTSKGVPTNAIFAFYNMLNKAINKIKPDYLLVAFDSGKKNFRHDMFEMYKGTRSPVPEDLIVQFSMVREFLTSFGIPYIEINGFEADDLIGSASRKYKDVKIDIMSSDRDLLQLINKDVNVMMIKSGASELKRMDEAALLEEYQLEPLQIIDLKGLSGDASDNIPGVAKVGEKSATKWLLEYKTLENVLSHADDIGGKMGERLKESTEIALLSKKLATIKLDIDFDISLEELAYKPNTFELMKFFEKYEMHSLASKIDIISEEVKSRSKVIYQDFTIEDGLTFYYESEYTNKLYFSNTKEVMVIEPSDIINDEEFINSFENHRFITFDIKALMHSLSRYNLSLSKNCDDLRIMQSLVDSSLANDLQTLLNAYSSFDFNMQNKSLATTNEAELTKLYASAVLEFAKIHDDLNKKIEAYEMHDLYHNVELPLTFVLFKMEDEGVNIDRSILNDIKEMCNDKISILKENIFDIVGHKFNLNSPKQLSEVLYDELELPCGKKRSTAQDVLEYLIPFNKVIAYILDYRKYAKLLSTYAEGLQKFIHEDGKIHTIYNQCLTTTGRLSSSDPNLQNISIRNEETKEVRKAFIPSKTTQILMAADYSQVELRMLAHFADCKPLIDAFKRNIDIHTSTAKAVFNVEDGDVTSLMRRQAKAVNFGIVYGISDFGLAAQIGVSKKEAQSFIDAYFVAYPHIKEYMDEIIAFCEEHKYVKTILNRRRFIKEIDEKNYMVREAAKRAAMNAPIQGSSADLIKVAMINIDNEMRKQKLKSKMILQVHDELIFEVEIDEKDIMAKLIEDGMENALKLNVPLLAEVKIGNNWLETK